MLYFILLLSSLYSVTAAELSDNYIPNKAEWLEYKMNQYANERNHTTKTNVHCNLGKDKNNKTAYLYCIDGDYKAEEKWKKVLNKMFQEEFQRQCKRLGICNKIILKM